MQNDDSKKGTGFFNKRAVGNCGLRATQTLMDALPTIPQAGIALGFSIPIGILGAITALIPSMAGAGALGTMKTGPKAEEFFGYVLGGNLITNSLLSIPISIIFMKQLARDDSNPGFLIKFCNWFAEAEHHQRTLITCALIIILAEADIALGNTVGFEAFNRYYTDPNLSLAQIVTAGLVGMSFFMTIPAVGFVLALAYSGLKGLHNCFQNCADTQTNPDASFKV